MPRSHIDQADQMSSNVDALWKAFVMIVVSEIGDKTFLIAAIMATRHARITVFGGAFTSLVVMSVLSAAMGRVVLGLVPKVGPYLFPESAIHKPLSLSLTRSTICAPAYNTAQADLHTLGLDSMGSCHPVPSFWYQTSPRSPQNVLRNVAYSGRNERSGRRIRRGRIYLWPLKSNKRDDSFGSSRGREIRSLTRPSNLKPSIS